jgi:hypothetical protein
LAQIARRQFSDRFQLGAIKTQSLTRAWGPEGSCRPANLP